MYICHCHAVTDRTIRAVIEAGARSATEVRRQCGAGSGCGGCYRAVRELVAAYCPDMGADRGPRASSRGAW
jgi:bacterioferritin-associated ferredoxin